jgi:signal transduction histidine kinase
MSHELRTPLNGILGFAELLQGPNSGSMDEKQLKFLGLISQSGRHLLDLINDLLDLARIDSGAIHLQKEVFDVQAWIQDTVTMIRPQMAGKNLQPEFRIERNLPPLVADQRRCRQILLNLLSNAIKYSPEGGVICVEARPRGDSSLRVSVRDAGPGIEFACGTKTWGARASAWL